MIAKISGLTLNQVKYVLNPNGWLRKSNLVVRTKSGWIAQPATAEQLNESVARPAGTLGKGEARRQRHKDERAIQAGQVIMKARFEYDSQNLAA